MLAFTGSLAASGRLARALALGASHRTTLSRGKFATAAAAAAAAPPLLVVGPTEAALPVCDTTHML